VRERRGLRRWAAPVLVGGAGLAAYAVYEPYRFRLATLRVPVAAGSPEVDLLHVSDTHMTSSRRALGRWLGRLPQLLERRPDLVAATGDLIENDTGIEPLVDALAGLGGRLGSFYVLGSHDYYQSEFRPGAYLKYFRTDHERVKANPADVAALEDGLRTGGWRPLTNATETVHKDGATIRIAGVDDPYIRRHRTDHIERGNGDDLAIGLVHAPDVVSEWMLAGFDLVLAGHTHGGQVRLPVLGPLVTNCSLPAALAGGLHRVGNGWLHVSPGLGSGRFARIRFARPPEATLLQIRPVAS
jgi:predicted MPP superfamily phosphohydrolase